VLFPSNFRLIKGGVAFALVAVTGPAALAQNPAPAELTVTAQIVENCVLNGGSLNFGTYSSSAVDDTPGEGTFTYQCTGGTEITLSLGPGTGGGDGVRQMASGEERLTYELFQDPSHSTVWGEDGDALTVPSTSSSSTPVPVYGLIDAGQESGAGTYSDTVQITLNIE
jgi:spore coat protein U-like protein